MFESHIYQEPEFQRLKVNYPLPELLEEAINALEQGVKDKVLYIDCLQNEVHSCARLLDDEEKEREIIQYYCYKRWL